MFTYWTDNDQYFSYIMERMANFLLEDDGGYEEDVTQGRPYGHLVLI